jgi:hypothetical protein
MYEPELFIFREHAPGFNPGYFEKSVLLIILVFCFVCHCFASCTTCCPCLWIVQHVVRVSGLYNMLSVSLDCTTCCPCLWIVQHVVRVSGMYNMLSVSLDCTTCCPCLWIVQHVVMSLDCTTCCPCLWIVQHVVRVSGLYNMLSVSLDCTCLITTSCFSNV